MHFIRWVSLSLLLALVAAPICAQAPAQEFEGQPIYKVGNGVTMPKPVKSPDPDYSKEAKRAHYEGVAVLSVIVDPKGRPQDIRILRSLGYGLDDEAVKAVKRWRFKPGTKNGQPVAVLVNIEINFHLY